MSIFAFVDDLKGMANDLKEFQKLVNRAAGTKHVKDTAIELFNSLFPEDQAGFTNLTIESLV